MIESGTATRTLDQYKREGRENEDTIADVVENDAIFKSLNVTDEESEQISVIFNQTISSLESGENLVYIYNARADNYTVSDLIALTDATNTTT